MIPEPDLKPVPLRSDRTLLTITEAAKRMGVSKTYLYDRAKEGELSVVYLGNGRVPQMRVLLEDLQRFIDSRRVIAK